MERKEYTMTTEQKETIIAASQPVLYMIVGGAGPSSPQENANDAWRKLGDELKFDYMTAKPSGDDLSKFTAVPKGK